MLDSVGKLFFVFSFCLFFFYFLFQVVIIAPLLVAYRSQGFWMRSSTYQEQAEVGKLKISRLPCYVFCISDISVYINI